MTRLLRIPALVVLLCSPVTAQQISVLEEQPVEARRPSFRNEVMAVLSRSGCSLGTCHGNQNGKGGLKLSLRGQDPDLDFVTLTRQLAGRRTNVLNPEDSLLLRKPSMQVPHEGGRRFSPDDAEYRILRDWIAHGMPGDADGTPVLTELEITPSLATLHAPQRDVALKATARFSDGTERDVTSLAVFESSDPSVLIRPTGVAGFPEPDISRQTSVTVRYLNQQATARLEYVPDRPGFQFLAPAPANVVDQHVFRQLERLKINPSPVCDDATFVRRLYLDLTGLLPTPQQARDFLESQEPDKRSLLIDKVLDSPEFVDFQTLRWADLLRVEDKTLDSKGVEIYYRWIRESVAADKALNVFASEIVAARGSTYTEPAANFYRALRTPEERAESAAQVFFGIRLQCAKCHNHPFDRWTQDDYYGWTNYFARVDYKIIENRRRDENDKHEFNGEQIVLMKKEGDVRNPSTGKRAGLRLLGETNVDPQDGEDRLLHLSKWLAGPDNHQFAVNQANRVWFQLMGTGIVDPIDDFRSTNPPSHPELLQALSEEFAASGFSVRKLMRLILNSRTWQLSHEPNDTNRTDESLFSRVVPRRLTAEQTLDALAQVLQTSPAFGGHPQGTRAVQLVGVRNGGNRYSRPEIGDRFLALFGKPGRLQTCECERTGETTLAQTMELVSGELISEMLKSSDNRVARAVSSDQTTDEFLDELYWSALTRAPTEDERTSLRVYIEKRSDRASALQDVTWAVLNSSEFLLRR